MCSPRSFALITRTAPCLRQLPWLGCRLPARLKLVRFPAHSPLPIAALPSMSLSQSSIPSLATCSMSLDSRRLRCIPAAPAALDRYLAALPAMSLIPFAPFASTAFNIRTGHRQRPGSGIISRSGELTMFGFQPTRSSTCTRLGTTLTISGERNAQRWL
jgi:hypothetical protein